MSDENDKVGSGNTEMIRFESEDLQEFNTTLKELGNKYLSNQDKDSERDFKIKLKQLENESKEMDLSKSNFRWDRVIALIVLAALITLSIFEKLPIEIGYIMVAVMFSLLPFNRLKKAISEKIAPPKEGAE